MARIAKALTAVVVLWMATVAVAPAAESAGEPGDWTGVDALRAEVCSYRPLLDGAGEDRERLEGLYLEMLGVLSELHEYRAAFLAGGKPIDLFPTAYYHVTATEMRDVARGDFSYPVEKLEQLLAFYDAYVENRKLWDAGSPLVEAHWREHFEIAAAGDLETEQKPRLLPGVAGWLDLEWPPRWVRQIGDLSHLPQALLSGGFAHIGYDLPRAIDHAFHGRPKSSRFREGCSEGSLDCLSADFRETDRVFAVSRELTQADIVRSTALPGGPFEALGRPLQLVDETVIALRHLAWFEAAGDATPLPGRSGLGPQPVRHHEVYRAEGERFCEGFEMSRATFFLVDTSGSMEQAGKMEQARRSVLRSVRSMRGSTGGRTGSHGVGLLTFAGGCSRESTRSIVELTTDLERVEEFLTSWTPEPAGRTPLPEALEVAREHLRAFQRRYPEARRPSLVVLSDGESTCGPIRPPDAYGFVSPGSRRSSGAAAGFVAVGFDLEPGSAGERDLQYLASTKGGRYFNAQKQRQVARAFEKAVRSYRPKRYPALSDVSAELESTFADGVLAILGRRFEGALRSFFSYLEDLPSDSAAHYNLALGLDASERYLAAAEHYRRYLDLAPETPDRAAVEREILLLRQDHRDHRTHQVALLRSDLEYLERYYRSLFHRDNDDLAAEFAGFVREKKELYARLPKRLGIEEPWLERAADDLSDGLARISARLGEPTFDRDAVSLLAPPIGRLEEIVERLEARSGGVTLGSGEG